MLTLRYEDVIGFLEDALPALRADRHWERDLPYSAAGTFAILLGEKIEAGADESDPEVARALLAIQELGAVDDERVQALLRWGILEVLVDRPPAEAVARRVLTEGAKKALGETLDLWRGTLEP
jgi:hypothetical protein